MSVVFRSQMASGVDFPTLMSAVKPRERTDQYVILAAMFALSAHSSSVTAAQLSALLRLHLGAKTPANVSASLRAYTAYVAPTETGPPLRWSLTSKGIEHLRVLSGLGLPTGQVPIFL
jgi:hypothetical protein